MTDDLREQAERISALESQVKEMRDDIGRLIAAYYLIKKILEKFDAEIDKLNENGVEA